MTVTVAWFPKTCDLRGNPYWERLQHALEGLGVEFDTTHNSYWMQRRWLFDHRINVDVLHFHFIQPLYVVENDRASIRRLRKFASDLFLARAMGYRIVWTMHDLMPTWPTEPRWVEKLARYVIACTANDVIVHCREAERLLLQRFRRRRRVHVLPHPGYAEVYPNNTTAIDARRRLNIENDNFVVTFFGGIRPNKGLDGLITAFSQIDDPKALLLIAGRPWPPEEYVKKIRHLVGSDDRILLRTIEVPDTEVQIYLKASDVVVFPFKQVLTSGSTLLAMSFGRPVIVPKIGCLPELVDAGAGIVYDPTDPVGLLSALRDARQCDLAEMGRIAYTQSQRASWRDLAYQTAAVYRGEDV